MIEQNNSGQNGSATLGDTPEGLQIEVHIKRSSVTGSQTSHIHEGRCDNVGAITAGLRPISMKEQDPNFDGDDIVFKTTLNTTLQKVRDHNHVINVHDARENSLYVSCGEID
ncbi:MAG: hypothetical protein IPJ65_31495 [Archangiaceae bacterium]|nr:hypothetical protein [Archangiaceae bacterium]